MSQDTAIKATKILTDHSAVVSRDAPFSVAADERDMLAVLGEIRRELTALRLTLARASNIFITPEDF